MAYVTLPSKSDGDAAYTAADINQIQANCTAGIPDLMTTKGDIVLGTGLDAATRLGVGANGSYLVADSAQASGAKYVHNGAVSAYDMTTTVNGNYLVSGSEYFDVFGLHNVSTGRYTPPATGYYFVSLFWVDDGTAGAPSAVNTSIQIALYNVSTSSFIIILSRKFAQSTSDITPALMGSAIVYLTAGHDIRVRGDADWAGGGAAPKGASTSRIAFIRLGSVGV